MIRYDPDYRKIAVDVDVDLGFPTNAGCHSVAGFPTVPAIPNAPGTGTETCTHCTIMLTRFTSRHKNKKRCLLV
jgi:hypothetical protein